MHTEHNQRSCPFDHYGRSSKKHIPLTLWTNTQTNFQFRDSESHLKNGIELDDLSVPPGVGLEVSR